MSKEESPTIIIGLSGPSSSGKTTLARLLRGVFNIEASSATNGVSVRLFILHEDDFYKTDKDIPIRTITSKEHGTRPLQDWDCVESLNLPLLTHTISHVKSHGRPPPDMISIEDKNSVGEVGVSEDEVRQFHDEIVSFLHSLPATSTDGKRDVTICILDGFLLFPPPPHLQSTQDLESTSTALLTELYETLANTLTHKVFLPSTKEQTLARRANRSGYVTIEGFWADPPGYVEDVVWPNFTRDHGWMFGSEGDGDRGVVDRGRVEAEGILVGPGNGERKMGELLEWGVEVLRAWVGDVVR